MSVMSLKVFKKVIFGENLPHEKKIDFIIIVNGTNSTNLYAPPPPPNEG